MTNSKIMAAIVVEAIDELETASTYLDWIDSLSWAAKRMIADGNDYHAERLSDVAQYLASDYRQTLTDKTKRLNDRFDVHQHQAHIAMVPGGSQ